MHVEPLTKAAGLLPSTGERILRVTRPARQSPPGKQGGAEEWQPSNAGYYLLAMMAPEPIVSAKVAAALAECEYLCSPGADEQGPRCGPGSVKFHLDKMIETAAYRLAALHEGNDLVDEAAQSRLAAHHAEQELLSDETLPKMPHYLNVCLNPLRVDMVWMSSKGQERVDVYAEPFKDPRPLSDEPWRNSAVTRWTTLPTTLIVEAGRMILNMRLQRGRKPSKSPKPKTKNAASPGRKRRLLVISPPPVLTANQGNYTPRNVVERENSQALRYARTGHGSPMRSDTDGKTHSLAPGGP